MTRRESSRGVSSPAPRRLPPRSFLIGGTLRELNPRWVDVEPERLHDAALAQVQQAVVRAAIERGVSRRELAAAPRQDPRNVDSKLRGSAWLQLGDLLAWADRLDVPVERLLAVPLAAHLPAEWRAAGGTGTYVPAVDSRMVGAVDHVTQKILPGFKHLFDDAALSYALAVALAEGGVPPSRLTVEDTRGQGRLLVCRHGSVRMTVVCIALTTFEHARPQWTDALRSTLTRTAASQEEPADVPLVVVAAGPALMDQLDAVVPGVVGAPVGARLEAHAREMDRLGLDRRTRPDPVGLHARAEAAGTSVLLLGPAGASGSA